MVRVLTTPWALRGCRASSPNGHTLPWRSDATSEHASPTVPCLPLPWSPQAVRGLQNEGYGVYVSYSGCGPDISKQTPLQGLLRWQSSTYSLR